MTFATPLFAAIAAAIAIPALLILYFLKLRRRDLEVSTTLLWKKAIQDLQANAPFQKLRRNLLLFLQLLALAAAIFALAQPEFKSKGTIGQKHVILIDRSASMSSTDGDPEAESGLTRLAEAKRRAIELVDSLPEPGLFRGEGETAMVIAFASGADVVQNFTGNKAVLRDAIESIRPAYEPSSLKQAMQLTRAHAGTRKFEEQLQENVGFVPRAPTATIHLFSDGRIFDLGSLDTTSEDVIEYYPIGAAESANIGLVSMASSRAFNDPRKLKIGVGLMSTDLQRRDVQVQIAIDGVARDVIDVSIPAAIIEPDQPEGGSLPQASPPAVPTGPQGTAGAAPEAAAEAPGGILRPGGAWFDFEIDRVEGGIVTAQLRQNQPDALPADDTAYLVAPPAQRLSVLLVTPGNYFIEPALEGLSLTRLLRVTPEQFQTMVDGGRILDASLADFDVMILDRTLPEITGTDGARSPGLPPGRVLTLGVVPPGVGLEDNGPGEASVLLTWEPDSPIMKYADPQNLQIAESRLVSIQDDPPALIDVLAEADTGPAILELSSARTRAIVVPFDPLKSTWPFSPGYPMFIATSVTYLADDGAAGVGDVIAPGDTLSERLPLDASNVALVLPDRHRVALEPSPDGTVTYEPIEQTGIYTIEWTGAAASSDAVIDGRVRRYIASNLLNPDESTIAAEEALALPHDLIAGNQPQNTLLQRKLWPWLLLAALAVVMFEWFIYNRKVYV